MSDSEWAFIRESEDERDALIAENEDLKRRLGEMQVQLDEMGDVLLRMARAADRTPVVLPKPPLFDQDGPREASDWLGTAEWRGPSSNYWGNMAEINHRLAREAHRLFTDTSFNPNPLEITQQQRKPPDVAAIEAHGRENSPESPPDPQAGP